MIGRAPEIPPCSYQNSTVHDSGDHATVERPADSNKERFPTWRFSTGAVLMRVCAVPAASICWPTMKAGLYIPPQLGADRG